MSETLSVRFDETNPNHHLWDNHGTWWIHYTVHTADSRIRRVRRSLRTRDLDQARQRRDRLFESLLVPSLT